MQEPQQYVQVAKEICQYLVHAFGTGTLTQTGSQYGTTMKSTSTGSASDATVVNTVTVQPFNDAAGYGTKENEIIEVEFGLTAGFKSVTDTAAVIVYKWQAKNASLSDTCYVDLSTANTTALGTTYVDQTYSGYFTPTTNFNKVPFNVRLLIWNNDAGSTQSSAKTKNSSYIKVLYRVQ
jgi:hypothetical protein